LAKLGNRLVQLLAADGHENCQVSLERRRFRAPRFLVTLDPKAPPHAPIALTPARAELLVEYLSESARVRLIQDFRNDKGD